MITDAGLCWAINSKDMRDIYKPSPRLDAFLGNLGHPEHKQADIMNIPGHGGNHTFYLNIALKGISWEIC